MAPTTVTPPQSQKKERDLRLDFFRGLCLFIILTAHTPVNSWTLWIPARFGFSDAAEIFVFCSGMASAIAFGGTFLRAGWWMGTARILFRCWQIYWAQICVILGILVMLIFADQITAHEDFSYVRRLPIHEIVAMPKEALTALLTMRWSPNYFDILPMYFVILLMVPVIMLLARVHVGLAIGASILIWFLANIEILELPWSPWNPDAEWFFNPFGWQLLFFTGFAFMMGWLPKPPVNRTLVIICLVYVIVAIPLAYFRTRNNYEVLGELWTFLRPLREKTDEGLLRYLHLLALAYLAYVFSGDKGHRLRGWFGDRIRRVGQQSLPVFLSTYFIAQFNGIILRETRGETFLIESVRMPWFTIDWQGFSIWVSMQSIDVERLVVTAVVNIFGYLMLFVVAEIAFFFKGQPWRKKPGDQPAKPAPEVSATAPPLAAEPDPPGQPAPQRG